MNPTKLPTIDPSNPPSLVKAGILCTLFCFMCIVPINLSLVIILKFLSLNLAIFFATLVYYRYIIRRQIYNIYKKSDSIIIASCIILTILTILSSRFIFIGIPIGIIGLIVAISKTQNILTYHYSTHSHQSNQTQSNTRPVATSISIDEIQNSLSNLLKLSILLDIIFALVLIAIFDIATSGGPAIATGTAVGFFLGPILIYAILPCAIAVLVTTRKRLQYYHNFNTPNKKYHTIGIISTILSSIPIIAILGCIILIMLSAI